MSVIIKGLEMPAKCAHCPMCYDFERGVFYCSAIDDAPTIENIFAGRPDYCPLEEIEDEYKH